MEDRACGGRGLGLAAGLGGGRARSGALLLGPDLWLRSISDALGMPGTEAPGSHAYASSQASGNDRTVLGNAGCAEGYLESSIGAASEGKLAGIHL